MSVPHSNQRPQMKDILMKLMMKSILEWEIEKITSVGAPLNSAYSNQGRFEGTDHIVHFKMGN